MVKVGDKLIYIGETVVSFQKDRYYEVRDVFRYTYIVCSEKRIPLIMPKRFFIPKKYRNIPEEDNSNENI